MDSPLPTTTPPIDSAVFRQAMSHHPSAVHLVTTDGVAGRRGVTVSSACSVSDEPPTLLVCLNNSSALNERFELNGHFAVNLLGAGSEALARVFAGQGGLSVDERFAHGEWEPLATGAPVLASAAVGFDCRLVEARSIATHRVLVGEVVAVRENPRIPALVYLDRGFHTL